VLRSSGSSELKRIDVTIVDTESDLNIYAKDKEDGHGADDGAAGCCASTDEVPSNQNAKECCSGSVSLKDEAYACLSLTRISRVKLSRESVLLILILTNGLVSKILCRTFNFILSV
jgi:hypothetical protein